MADRDTDCAEDTGRRGLPVPPARDGGGAGLADPPDGARGQESGERRRKMSDLVVGIDLGTTNSEVAAFLDGRVRVLVSFFGREAPVELDFLQVTRLVD